MIRKHTAILFFLLALSMPCFAGGIKGDLIDDKTLGIIILFIVLVHIFSIFAYYARINWLRIACGVLYLPVFLIPLILSLFIPMLALLFIPTIAFYVLTIGRTRK